MEPRPASAGFPFAIRARLSTEDSASDASSFIAGDSDDSSGIDGSEREDVEEAGEDNAASFRRPFMPIARITGDDEEDDALDELVFDDDDEVCEKEEGYVDEAERMAASIDDAGAVEGGLGLNDVRVEIDFSAVVYEKIGAVGFGDMKQSKGFDLELKDLVVDSSVIGPEKSNLVGDNHSTQNPVMEVELRTSAADLIVPEVEDNFVEFEKFEASGAITSSPIRNEEADAKTEEAGVGVSEDIDEEGTGYIDSKNGFFDEKKLEACEVEADSSESEGFEATGIVHSQILEMASLPPDCKAFEPKQSEVSVNMEAERDEDLCRKVYSADSEKAKDSTGKLFILTGSDNVRGICSPINDVSAEKTMVYSAQYSDNLEEKKNDESGAVKEVSMAENYSAYELSSENFSSSFYAYENEMDSCLDSFHVSHYENSAAEDELVISEWPAGFFISENSESVKHILKEMEEVSSQSDSHILCCQTTSNSDEEDNAKELFDTSALASLLRASNGASSGTSSHLSSSQDASTVNDLNGEQKALHLKIEQIRKKYLHLVARLGHSPDDALPHHLLHRMSSISEKFNLEMANKAAMEVDEEKEDDFSFSCNILVLGKTGVGKSSAINSIFGEDRAFADPFRPATASAREISGMVDGVYIRAVDTPGLRTCSNDQSANRKILSSIKKYVRRCPPDIVLYVDRLDAYGRDFAELPMFRMITSILGSSIWFNAIVALTHADLAFPDGPDGSSLSYETVVARRSAFVRRLIRRAAGDPCLSNSVALVENHPFCRKNMEGEGVLPDGLRWRPRLLLLCYSFKILSELDSLMKLEISSPPKRLFPFQWLCFLPVFLSSIIKPNAREEGDGDDYDSDFVLDDMTKNVPEEEDDEYDQLAGEQKSAYLLEADPDAAAVPLSDTALPPSFDGENPTSLYRFLEPRSRLFARPVCGRGRDCAPDGASVNESIGVGRQFPKDRKFTIQLDSSIESEHGENGSTLATFSIQPTGKHMAYSLLCEANLRNLEKKKKMTGTGDSATFSGKTMADELELEDQILLGKKFRLVASSGAARAQRNMAYGVNLEACFREKNDPIGRVLSTSPLSMIKWREFSAGAYFQSEFSAGGNSKMEVCVGVNNRSNGRISIKTSAGEQVHITLLGLLSLVLSIFRSRWNSKTS